MRRWDALLAVVMVLSIGAPGNAQQAKPTPSVADDFVSAELREPVPTPLAAG